MPVELFRDMVRVRTSRGVINLQHGLADYPYPVVEYFRHPGLARLSTSPRIACVRMLW